MGRLLSEQIPALARGQAIAVSQCASVLGGCLTMRTHRGGLVGRCRSEAENGVGVARGVSVMRETCRIRQAFRRLGESCKSRAMEAQPTPRLYRLLDRQTCELVAERDRACRRFDQHPRVQTFLQRGQMLAGQHLEQPELHLRRDDRDRVEQPPCLAAQPCRPREHRIPHRRRDAAVPGGADFGHEEGVAGCDPVELARVDAVRLGELRDSLERERCEWHPCERESRRHLAEHDSEGVSCVERVVAVAQHDQRTLSGDPACEEPEHVECCLVGPVDVLDHEHGRCVVVQVVDQRGSDLVGDGLAAQRLLKLGPEVRCEVVYRPQWPRCEERVASTSQDPRPPGASRAERVDQRRLAAAGLSRDERDATPPRRRLVERGLEQRKLPITLDQLGDVPMGDPEHAHP